MLSDVIASLATSPGLSAIALIRISGGTAHEVAASVLSPFEVDPSRSVRRSKVIRPMSGEVLDDVVYVTHRGPKSYTGEDMVEISTHGGLLVPVEVLEALFASGARLAAPGEYTRRALVNGKLDLLQAESIGDLIAATAPAQRRAALDQLDRGFSSRIGALRDEVLQLEALCCYEIDFPEEDTGPLSEERIDDAVSSVARALRGLLGTVAEGERIREGALCVVAGRPNAGKSSLFNALLGNERAIVTDSPGTTRDAIEAPTTCDGFPFRLVDTAGLRVSEQAVERLGVEVSYRYLADADVVLLCVEAPKEISDEERAFVKETSTPTILVRTKVDLIDTVNEASSIEGDIAVSAVSGVGIPDLRSELARVAFQRAFSQADTEPVVTRARHRVALEAALREITEFKDARLRGLDTVVSATHLRAAVSALEGLVGVVTTDDVLDEVFSTFCVGK